MPNMEAVILARPTKSLTVFVQQSLRPLRPDPDNPKKVAIIIDHVQNYQRFGLPDEDRNWTLAPNPKKQEGTAPLMSCPECYEVVPISTQTCPQCGYEFVTEEEKEARLREKAGILEQLKNSARDDIKIVRPSIKHKPTTPEEFLVIAKEKNYKIGWVAIQSLEYAKSYDDCLHIAEVCGYKPGWAWYQWKDIQDKVREEEAKSRKFTPLPYRNAPKKFRI